jgi:signal transduction histidine kinase
MKHVETLNRFPPYDGSHVCDLFLPCRCAEWALSRVGQELPIQEDIDFHVIVDGRKRPLRPILRDEVYRNDREAPVDAFRHSRAKSVEATLEYKARRLRMLVRDNGCGMDAQVLRSGREGHWGLAGMRERAERIGHRDRTQALAVAVRCGFV